MVSRYFFSIVLFICFCDTAKAQNPDVIPPSPEVNRMMEYERIRSQDFHGLPVIGLPLYEVVSGKLSSPIQLSYNYSGFRPHDTFSRVGIGWDLKAGGVVSRTIYGLPDDSPAGHLLQSNAILDVGQFNSFTHLQEYEHLRGIIDGEIDSEYDIFNYSIGERSDSFILIRTSEGVRAVSLSGDTITKIIPDIDIFSLPVNLNGFTILTEDGTSYRFGENWAVERYIGTMHDRTSSWFLTSIMDFNKTDTIRFEYETGYRTIYTDDSYISDDQQLYFDHSHWPLIELIQDIGNIVNNSAQYYTKYLKKIWFRGGWVDLTYSSDVLDNITVRNFYGQGISSFDFTYSPLCTGHPHMKLDRVRLLDGTDYSFDYHEAPTHFTYGPSPSYSRDWYGYYNRSGNFYNSRYALHDYAMDFGYRRDPDFIHTRAFALTKLTYPTKGNNEFVWEQNKVLNNSDQLVDFAGLRIKEVRYKPIEGQGFIEEYKYGFNENGAGDLSLPVEDREIVQFFLDFWPCSYCPLYNYTKRYTLSQYKPVPRMYPRNVYYLNIAKYISDGSSGDKLKESSEYYFPFGLFNYHRLRSGYMNRYWIYSLGPNTDPNYFFPLYESIITSDANISQLKQKKYFRLEDGIYKLVKKEEYNYHRDVYREFAAFKAHRLAKYQFLEFGIYYTNKVYEPRMVIGESTAGSSLFNIPPIVYNPVTIRAGRTYLSQKRTVDYHHSDSTVNLVGYYDQGFFLNPVSFKTFEQIYTNAFLSWSQRQVFGLPYANSGLIMGNAFQNNYSEMVNAWGSIGYYPILGQETTRKVEDFTTFAENTTVTDVIEYGYFNGNKVYPKYTYSINGFSDLYLGNSYSQKTKIVEYKRYDRFANPLEVVRENGTTVSYIWGYNGLYPVAKIENATYAEIEAVLDLAALDNLNQQSVTEADIENTINMLREHPGMNKAIINTYTYKPLVGMASMTDPRGIKETYEYDNFHRLKDVLDFDGNILKNYRYNYKP